MTDRAPTSVPSGMVCPPATYDSAAIQTSFPIVSDAGLVGPAGATPFSLKAASRQYWLIVDRAPIESGAWAQTTTPSPSELLRPIDKFHGLSIRTLGRIRTVGSSRAPNICSNTTLALYRGLGVRRKSKAPIGQSDIGSRDRACPSSLPNLMVGSTGSV